MTLRRCFLFLMAAGCLVCNQVTAAEIAGWGTIVNPDGDCTITEANGVVTFRLPKTKHDLWYGGAVAKTRFNSPRVWQQVEGDFVATVRVTAHWRAGIAKGGYNGAGLVVWESEKQYLRLERNRMVNPALGPSEFSFTTPLYDQNNRRVFYNSTKEEFFKGKSTWLRVARHGTFIVTWISHDQKNWIKTGVVATEFPDKVQVGINATNSTGQEFAVAYDQFSIKKP